MIADPFLCLVTPIFDGASKAIELLCKEIQEQTEQDYIHVMISNGESPVCKDFISSLPERFIYCETPKKQLANPKQLLIDLGHRRNFVFKNFDAQRYICIDADLKITDKDYFKYLRLHHNQAEILVIKAINPTPTSNQGYLPRFPLTKGRIDLSNFSFTKNIARKYSYPTDFDLFEGFANDWRFFKLFYNQHTIKYLPKICAIVSGNACYKRMSDLLKGN